jgi:hypothetical protein
MTIITRNPTLSRKACLRQQNKQSARAAAEPRVEAIHTTEISHVHAHARRGQSSQEDEHLLSLERAVIISNVYRMQANMAQSAKTSTQSAAKTTATKGWLWRLPSVWPHT